MKISVVIPLYNKAPHINRTLNSVLAQAVKADEIIVVDDGSTDGGAEIVGKHNDPIIKIVRQENKGQSGARNRGVEESRNSLIAFLDADDEWHHDFLKEIEVLINNFPDCGAYTVSSYTIRPDGSIYYPDIALLPPEPWIGIIPNFFALFQRGLAFNSSSIVIPKVIINDVGGYPEKIRQSEDADLWVRIAVKYPIAFSPKRLAVYHQDAKNRVAPTNSDLIEDPVIKRIQSLIEDRSIPSGELKNEAMEYVAKKQITVAINNIMVGNRKNAIAFLEKSKYTKKYKKDWLKWRMFSFFPAGIPKRLLSFKESIRGY